MSRIVENQIPFFKNYIKKHESADFTTADIEYIYRYVHEKEDEGASIFNFICHALEYGFACGYKCAKNERR